MIFLAALVFWLLSAAPALAEPITLSIAAAIGLGGFVTAGSTAAFVGSLLLTTAVTVGASLLMRQLAPKTKQRQEETAPSTAGPGGTELSLSTDPSLPRTLILGTRATAGSLVFWCTSGVNNEWLTMVIALADHQCQSLEKVYVDGKLVSWPPSAGAAATGHIAIPEYSDGAGNNYMTVAFYDGSPAQFADDIVILDSPLRTGSLTEKEWTTSHKLNGVAYVVVKCGWNKEVFRGGSVPSFLFELRGAKLYDPRKDLGLGGSHIWGFPSTYEWTENLEVARYNYLRGIAFDVDGQPLFGVGLADSAIDHNRAIAAMNSCDEVMLLRFPTIFGGSEFRYRVSALVTSDMQHRTVLEKLALACGGDVPDLSGRYALTPGVAQIAVASIVDGDILVGEELTGSRHSSRREKANEVVGAWANPEALYQRVDVPARWSPDDEALDGGFRNSTSFDLEFVASQTQGQRVLEIMRRLERRQRTHQITLGRQFSYLEAGDWIVWNSDVFGLVERQFRIEQISLHPDWRVTLQIREIDNATYAWNYLTDEIDPANPQPLASGGPDVFQVDGFAIAMVTVTGPNGEQMPGLRCVWTAILDPTVVAIRIEYRRVGDTPWLAYTWPFPATGAVTITDGIVPGAFYEARATPVCDPPRTVQVTVPVSTATVAPTMIVNTVVPGGITFESLDEDLQDQIGGITTDTDPPDVPTGLVLASVLETQASGEVNTLVTADWNDVASANLSYYQVEIKEGTGGFVAFQTSTSLYQWRGIRQGTAIQVRVRSVSANGIPSAFSTTASHTVVANNTPSSPVTSLAGTGSFQTVFLSWISPPQKDTAYVEVWESLGVNDRAFATLVLRETYPSNTAILTGRVPEETYYYWVRTVNTSGVISPTWTPVSATGGLAVMTASLAMTDFGLGIRPVEVVSTLPATDLSDGRIVFLTTDKKLYRYKTGTGWAKDVDGQDILANTITAGSIAAGAIVADKLAVGSYSANLAPNPGFEGSISPWVFNGGAPVGAAATFLSTTNAFAGSGVLELDRTTTAAGTAFATASLPAEFYIPVERGVSYEIAASIQGSSASVGGGFYVTIGWYDANKTLVGTTNAIVNAAITTGWVRHANDVTLPVVAPDNARFAVPVLYNNTESTSRFLRVDEFSFRRTLGATIIQDGAIITRHITLNTLSGDRIFTGSLDADKIKAATILASSVVLSGSSTPLGTVDARAENPLGQANGKTTQLLPGLVLISGATTLQNWRNGPDATKIEGGAIAANTITANKLTIGNRGIGITGLEFQVNKATQVVTWVAGLISYEDDAGTGVQQIAVAGNPTGVATGGALTYFYWNKDAPGTVLSTTSISLAQGPNKVILAQYNGGSGLNANYGNTIIDGDRIVTNTIQANRIVANSITATQLSVTGQLITVTAQIGDLVVTNAKIENLTIGTGKVAPNAISNLSSGQAGNSAGASLLCETGEKVAVIATLWSNSTGNTAPGMTFSLTTDGISNLVSINANQVNYPTTTKQVVSGVLVVTEVTAARFYAATTIQYLYTHTAAAAVVTFTARSAPFEGMIVDIFAIGLKK